MNVAMKVGLTEMRYVCHTFADCVAVTPCSLPLESLVMAVYTLVGRRREKKYFWLSEPMVNEKKLSFAAMRDFESNCTVKESVPLSRPFGSSRY